MIRLEQVIKKIPKIKLTLWIRPKCYYSARRYPEYLKIANRDMENQSPKEGIKKQTLFVFSIHFKILCSANPEQQKILFAPVGYLINL